MGNDHLDEAICFTGLLPAAWIPHSDSLSAVELAVINERNLTLLTAISVLEEQGHQEIHEHALLTQEMARLDAKVDLLLSLVTRLLAEYKVIPPALDITLSSRNLLWREGLSVAVGDVGVVELFIHPGIAAPLSLPATVEDEGRAAIHGLTAQVQSGLEKYLFRQHRRAIAESRQPRV